MMSSTFVHPSPKPSASRLQAFKPKLDPEDGNLFFLSSLSAPRVEACNPSFLRSINTFPKFPCFARLPRALLTPSVRPHRDHRVQDDGFAVPFSSKLPSHSSITWNSSQRNADLPSFFPRSCPCPRRFKDLLLPSLPPRSLPLAQPHQILRLSPLPPSSNKLLSSPEIESSPPSKNSTSLRRVPSSFKEQSSRRTVKKQQ